MSDHLDPFYNVGTYRELGVLRAALREAVEYADFLMEQGWGRKHEIDDSEVFNKLKEIVKKHCYV